MITWLEQVGWTSLGMLTGLTLVWIAGWDITITRRTRRKDHR